MKPDNPIRVEPIDVDPPAEIGGTGPVLIQTSVTTALLYKTVHGSFGITWVDCYGVRCGWPNDEVLEQHRFWGSGLEDVEFMGEVLGSDWPYEQERSPWDGFSRTQGQTTPRRHFIVLFEDLTFEFLAKSFAVSKLKRSVPSIEKSLEAMLDDLRN